MSEAKISEAAVEAAYRAAAEVCSKQDGDDLDLSMFEDEAHMAEMRPIFHAALTAALPHLHPQPAELSFDVESMLAACVPGGSIVDPQVVADNIRAWAAERKPAERPEQQGELVELAMVEKAMLAHAGKHVTRYAIAELRALAATGKQQVGEVHGEALRAALTVAVRQNSHDMLMTGEEIRQCEAALAASQPGAQEPHGSEFAVNRTMEDAEAASDGMLPAALVPVADEWYRLCERRFAVDRIRISGKLAEAIVEAVCAAPPAQGIDLHRLVPPEWISDLIGGQMDDLTPGQAWRQGFNQCRERTLLLVEQALGDLPTSHPVWDEARAACAAILPFLPEEPVADWSKRGSQPTDWRNELLTLSEHHGPIPAFARSAMRVIARSMPAPPAPLGEVHGEARAIIEEFVQCSALGRPHGKLIAQAKDYLAARQPGVQDDPLIPNVMDRCIRELRSFIEVAHDYDLDEMAVQALETAIESMELRKQPAQGIDLGQFRPAVMTAIGFTGPNDSERKHLRSLLDLIDQRDAAPGVGNG